jgi:outer membrane protein assembly factor BamB
MSIKRASGALIQLAAVLGVIALLTPGGRAADWPRFMGPNGDGASPEKGLLRAWPADGPKVLWTVKLGPGYGGAAVRDGKVFVLDRVDQKQDVLRCLDLENGKEQWTFGYDAPGSMDHEGSRSTPTVGEKLVFIIGPFGQLHCLDRATHAVVWKKHLVDDFGGALPRWKVTQSPLLYQDAVIVAPQSAQTGVVALEQATGKERWRSGPVGPLAYASPKLLKLDGVEQFVVISTEGVAAVAAKDGAQLWRYAHRCMIPIPNVSDLGGGKLFVTAAYMTGSAIIQVALDGDKWNVKELARNNEIGGHCHPALVYQDHLYVLCNTNERNDGMVCFDTEGKLMWQTKREPFLCKGGSVLTADGLIYVMDGKSGELHVVEPSPAGFKSLAKAKLLEGKEIWGPLALADGRLLLRDQGQMKCVDLRPDKQ